VVHSTYSIAICTVSNPISNAEYSATQLATCDRGVTFGLTLFVPIKPTLNIAYTLPFNHQDVDQAHLKDKGKYKTSIVDGVYEDVTGQSNKIRISILHGLPQSRQTFTMFSMFSFA
jgi:hypothetical protein